MRVPTLLVITGVLASLPLAVARAELKTTATAVACLKPENLPTAEEAQKKQDRAQMDKLGCFPVMAGVPVKRIDDGKAGPVWQVILDPNGSSPMEVWARPSSFRE